MSKNIIRLTESEFNKKMCEMIDETVSHFLDKWKYTSKDPSMDRAMKPFDSELIDEIDVCLERYGWVISPITKNIEKNGKTYRAYICLPNDEGKRIGDWGMAAADLNMIANKHGMGIEQGKYKNLVANQTEDNEPKRAKKIKRNSEPEATSDKSGAHYFIIKPRSELNY